MTSKADLAKRASALRQTAAETGIHSIPRHFTDLEGIGYAGATEIAQLTLVARNKEWTLGKVVAALYTLSKLPAEAWSMSFMVAGDYSARGLSDGSPHFDWRDAPMKRFKNFADFYRSELEQTFGKWSRLQATWQRVVDGEISEPEGKRIVLGTHGGDRRSEQAQADQADNIRLKKRKRQYGTSREDTIDRLERDGHYELAAAVRNKTMSANAAAGYRVKPSPLDQLRKACARERATFRAEINR